MKRQIFTILIVLVLALAAGLMAQSPNTQPLPPSQQVDQSGQPEHTGHPDVDVDVGKNANNGVMDVDVKRHGDADTKAQDNGQTNTATGTTGTTTGTYGNNTDTNAAGNSGGYNNGTNAAGDNGNLPGTASDTPLVGLIGLLSLAGALALRANR
jgi:hypothetical protein